MREDFDAWMAGLPRKRSAACVLVRNAAGEIMIVKPTYRPGWLVPGGMIDENESPLHAASRECREELSLELPIGDLIGITYLAAYDRRSDTYHFLFDGGILDDARAATIRLPADELAEWRWAPRADWTQLLNPRLALSVATALEGLARGGAAYREILSEPPRLGPEPV